MLSSYFIAGKSTTPPTTVKAKEIVIMSSSQDAGKFDTGLGGFIDDSRTTYLIGHAHKISAENPEAAIIHTYTDSRIDALISLKYLFTLHPDILPGNVALILTCTSPDFNKTITDQPIQGKGKPAASHVDFVKLLVQCAGFDPIQDANQPKDIASHLRMKNELNLNKFKEWCNTKASLQAMDAEITELSTHATHSKHAHFDKLLKALQDLRKNLAADIDANEKKISAEKIIISQSAHITQETLNLLKTLRSLTLESADSKDHMKFLVHQYEKNCKKILGEDTYLSSINYYIFAPAQLSKDIDAIIKNAKSVLALEEQQVQEKSGGYRYIPFMK